MASSPKGATRCRQKLTSRRRVFMRNSEPPDRVDSRTTTAYIQCIYMPARTQIARWGNSLGIRLPKSVAEEARLVDGDAVELSVTEGVVVIKPSRPRYALNELVRRITKRNRHAESDWGTAAGDEAW